MPNEFVIKNGLIVESGTTTVTGSVTATGGFTGSLFGTASFALSSAGGGGGLTNFLEGFSSATQATSFLSASNAVSTVNFAIIPKGSGSILGAVPDGTAVGGNARGAFAIDFQLTRSLATQVASGPFSIIGGGLNNRISSTRTNSYCIIGGGNNNLISQLFGATIVGGGSNTIGDNDGWSDTILGGESNTITARLAATTVGGSGNTISGNGSFATVGGRANSSSGESAAIAGGRSNTANGTYATIGGGQSNTANGSNWPTVCGGFGNSAGANGNAVLGGYQNSCGGNGYSAIVGGESNSLGSQFYGFIGAGQSNSNQASYGVICGGRNNTVSAGSPDAAIGGGQSNTIFNSSWTVIGGGQSNSSNPGAGQSNQHNVIAGGLNNISNSNLQSYTKIPGGAYANASLYGQFAHASGRFAATGDAQAHELIWRNAITGSTPTELFLDGSSVRAILPATNTIWRGIIDIASVCTNAGGGTTVVGDVAAGSYEVTIKRLSTNTVLVGTVQIIGTLDTDTSMSTANFTIAADNTNEALSIVFVPPSTADGTTTFRVVATFRGLQIQY